MPVFGTCPQPLRLCRNARANPVRMFGRMPYANRKTLENVFYKKGEANKKQGISGPIIPPLR
jgi:hypothetical protein